MKRHYLSLVLFVLIPSFLSACGSGGGSSPTASVPLSPSVVTKSASSAVIRALTLGGEGVTVRTTLLLPVTAGSESVVIESRAKVSPGMSDVAQIFEEVQRFKGLSPSVSGRIFRVGTEGSIPFQQSCGSGNISHNGTPNDTSDDSFSITLSCSGFGADQGSTASGSFSSGPKRDANNVIEAYELIYGSYFVLNTFAINDFQNGSRIGTSTESSSRNGTILLDVAPGNCFRGSAFENVAGTFNITGTDRRDSDGDGLFELDEAYALTNLVISIAETPACANGPVTITLNGTQSFTNFNDASLNTSSTFNNVELIITPTTKLINGIISTKGFENSLSGTMTVSSGALCVNSTHSIVTETPFFTANGASCAVLGKQLLTNTTSGQVVAVSATAVGGLDVDVGNDGIIEDNFADCKKATVCTTP